jgi:hypothetical protein
LEDELVSERLGLLGGFSSLEDLELLHMNGQKIKNRFSRFSIFAVCPNLRSLSLEDDCSYYTSRYISRRHRLSTNEEINLINDASLLKLITMTNNNVSAMLEKLLLKAYFEDMRIIYDTVNSYQNLTVLKLDIRRLILDY